MSSVLAAALSNLCLVLLLIIFHLIKKNRQAMAGNLVIIEDEEDGPYIFLEIEDPEEIKDTVHLRVVRKKNKSLNEYK